MRTIPAAENAHLDMEVDREFEAGTGIPLKEAFDWLHGTIDGVEHRMPKARKL
jgi:hypothetical protein